MNRLLLKIIVQERLIDGSIKSTQSLVFTETLDAEYARKISVFHVLQAHSKDPLITSLDEVKFDTNDHDQVTINSDFIVRVASMIEVSEEQIQFLGNIDILGYDLGRTRIKKYLNDLEDNKSKLAIA